MCGVQVVAFAYGNDESINTHYQSKQRSADERGGKNIASANIITATCYFQVRAIVTPCILNAGNRCRYGYFRDAPARTRCCEDATRCDARTRARLPHLMQPRCTPPSPPRKKKHFANNNAGITGHYASTDTLTREKQRGESGIIL